MGLGLSTGSGEGGSFLPIVKWDARAGRLFRVDRAQGPNGWESNDVDLTMQKPRFAIDFGSIETGWMAFTATGPDFRMQPLGSPAAERPSKEHKAGFRVKVGGKVLDGVREFSASAKSVLSAIDSLHTTFEGREEAKAGKIPVVELTGSVAVVTNGPQGKVTSYSPVFDIVAWADRLPEMGDRTVPAPGGNGAAVAATPTAAPSNHVPPPAPPPTPAATAPAAAAMPSDW
jgi:hypothetical protein